MPYNQQYVAQFQLLLKILPCLQESENLLLKGGTAINLFYRDFPRISVDIDLTYKKIEDRQTTLNNMHNALERFEEDVVRRIQGVKITKKLSKDQSCILKLFIYDRNAMVKVEPNFIARGTVYAPQKLELSPRVVEEFGFYMDDIPVVSFDDVYAGKICAALNRQHPRDLFDIKLLFEHEGLTDTLRQAFVVYLASDSRPIHELLNPNFLDISRLYNNELWGMSQQQVTLDQLIQTREVLVDQVINSLTDNEKAFLLSVKSGEVDFSLLPISGIENLPALHWKLINIKKMDRIKRSKMMDKLKAVFDA